MKILTQGCLFHGQDLNQEPSEYKSELLPFKQLACLDIRVFYLFLLYCDVIMVHTADSVKMDSFGTSTVAIINTATISCPCLLCQRTLVQYHWKYFSFY
jgi:hypothetical protein